MASFGMSGYVFHGPLLDANPGFQITKILERSKSLSSQVYPYASIVRSFDQLIQDKELELIIVNTPDNTHYEYTKSALLAGKHVVVEKPFVQTVEQGEELIDLARSKGLILTVFQNRRWDGDFLTVQDVIKNKLLGGLVEYEAHFDRFRNYIQPETWKEDPESGTGILFNLGSHLIDQVIVLFGKPGSLNADIRILREGGSVDDYFDINLFYPEVKVNLHSSYLVRESGPRYILHGRNGSFLKSGIDPQEEALKKGEKPDTPDWGKEHKANWGTLHTTISGVHFQGRIETRNGDYPFFYNKLYDCLTAGTPVPVEPEDSLLGVKVINLAFRSSREGKTLMV